MAIPLREGCALAGTDVTGEALLAQRALARSLIKRQAHYYVPVKGNQPALQREIALLFAPRAAADYVEAASADHGRLEARRIWCSTALNAYLDCPHVGQIVLIERESLKQHTGERSCEMAVGITSRTPHQTSPQRVLAVNRGHWSIERVQDIIDWNDEEDHSRIRTGFGPENMPRLRRFVVGLLMSFQKPAHTIAEMMRTRCVRTRLVFDYVWMTNNSVTETRRR